jgi:hypothetical protein
VSSGCTSVARHASSIERQVLRIERRSLRFERIARIDSYCASVYVEQRISNTGGWSLWKSSIRDRLILFFMMDNNQKQF